MMRAKETEEPLEEPLETAHSHENSTCCLPGSRLPLGHALFLHTLYLLVIACVITTYSVPTKHQMYSGSCQEVSSSLATEVKWEICWGVPTDMSTCVSFLMTAQKSTQVSKGYPSMHSVNAVRFPANPIAWRPPARFLLYLSTATQVVQERWRWCLGSW